MSRTL